MFCFILLDTRILLKTKKKRVLHVKLFGFEVFVARAYPKGHIYDFYADLLEITKTAKNEVLIMDGYPNEEILNLYLKKFRME